MFTTSYSYTFILNEIIIKSKIYANTFEHHLKKPDTENVEKCIKYYL